MTYSFSLPTQAFSINAYRYRQNFVKTKEAREYEARMLNFLEIHTDLHDMADIFKARGGSFEVHITCVYPEHIFYNQAKQISAKTLDLSNVEKPILDLLINTHMGLDDRFVTKLLSEKKVGPNYAIEIKIKLRR